MILRRIFAVLLGIVIAALLVQVAELGVHAVSPPPPGMNMRNLETVKAYVAALPPSALLLTLVGWLLGTLLGTLIAARFGRTAITAYIVGGLFFCLGLYNAFVFPQPVWYSVALSVIYIAATFAGIAMAHINAARQHA